MINLQWKIGVVFHRFILYKLINYFGIKDIIYYWNIIYIKNRNVYQIKAPSVDISQVHKYSVFKPWSEYRKFSDFEFRSQGPVYGLFVEFLHGLPSNDSNFLKWSHLWNSFSDNILWSIFLHNVHSYKVKPRVMLGYQMWPLLSRAMKK